MKAWQYIKSDYFRHYGRVDGPAAIVCKALFSKNNGFRYSFWLRLCHFKSILYPIALMRLNRLSTLYGVQIPPLTEIGYGFYMGHCVSIVVNEGTVFGNNCNISQFLSIGTNKNTPAVIGDNVYIGPHVCIVEDVRVGSDSLIAAGAVVVKDVPSGSTVAGVPAKVISANTHPEYVQNRWTV